MLLSDFKSSPFFFFLLAERNSIMACSKSWHLMQTSHLSSLGATLVKDWVE